MKGKNVLCYRMRMVKRYWVIERKVVPGYKKKVTGIEIKGCFGGKRH